MNVAVNPTVAAAEDVAAIPLDELNPGDVRRFETDTHWAVFDRLRREDPVHFTPNSEFGPYWSITLELREEHRLVTEGIYRRVRHPMYSALVLYGVGHALVIPNWIAGPSNVVAFAILFSLRVHAEEQMMSEAFGDEYAAYAARTKRLVPGVW